MEEQLDEIEAGRSDYQETLSAFYEKFQTDLERAEREMQNLKEGIDDRRGVRQVRLADAHEDRPLRPVPRVQPLPRVHEHEGARAAGRRRRDAGRHRSLRELRPADGRQARALRPVPGVLGLPRVQDDAQADRDQAGRSRRPSPIRCSTRRARSAAPTSCASRGGSASSPRAASTRRASTCSSRRRACSCPKDGGEVVERQSRRGKVFFGCSNYPACDFTLWNRPLAEKCPKCGSPFLVEKTTKRHGRQLVCNTDGCDYASVGGAGRGVSRGREPGVRASGPRPRSVTVCGSWSLMRPDP